MEDTLVTLKEHDTRYKEHVRAWKYKQVTQRMQNTYTKTNIKSTPETRT